MYFLLPAREITNPTVKDFKASLSQYNELNYHTVPLCNYKHPHTSMREIGNNETLGTKSIKKSNPAIKSKPFAQTPPIEEENSLKCGLCGWNYPKNFVQQDKHSHSERCRNGNGETDKRLWSKCKNDIMLFRKKIKTREESRNKETENEKEKERERDRDRDRDREERVKKEKKRELEVEKKKEEEKELPKKSPAKKTPITMEIESSEDSDLDIPIQKESSATLKRQNPSTQIEVYDLEREDLKKVKKTPPTLPPPAMKMVGRKSATKAVFNQPPSSSHTVYTID